MNTHDQIAAPARANPFGVSRQSFRRAMVWWRCRLATERAGSDSRTHGVWSICLTCGGHLGLAGREENLQQFFLVLVLPRLHEFDTGLLPDNGVGVD